MHARTLRSPRLVLLAAPVMLLAACASHPPGPTTADVDSAMTAANQGKSEADKAMQTAQQAEQTAQKAEQEAQAANQHANQMYDRSLHK